MIVVQFNERLDRESLLRALAAERDCCPFFTFRFEESQRRLTIGVREPDQLPALEAMAYAFTERAESG